MLAGCVTNGPPEPAAAPPATPSKPVPAEYLPDIRAAEDAGRRLHEMEYEAALATRVLKDRGMLGTDRRIEGWLKMTRLADASGIRFVGTDDGRTGALYDVIWPMPGSERLPPQVTRHEVPQPLTSLESAMFRPHATALASGFRRCAADYRVVVLPGKSPQDNRVVYLLAAAADPNQIVLGGHHRVTVSPDGAELVETVPLTKSCIAPLARKVGGREIQSLFVSHILSPTPIETHVYMSLHYGLPVDVVTGAGNWRVDQGKITLMAN